MSDGCLLLLGCSNRKFRLEGKHPAISIYDGQIYRVVRKARREGYAPPDLRVLIVSAKYGLIDEGALIEWYDLQMTRNQAAMWRDELSASLDEFLEDKSFRSILLGMGQIYRLAISKSKLLQSAVDEGRVMGTWERIVFHMKQTKGWLIEQQALSDSRPISTDHAGRGHLVTLHSVRPLRNIVQMATAKKARS